jgi:hypothetical protein
MKFQNAALRFSDVGALGVRIRHLIFDGRLSVTRPSCRDFIGTTVAEPVHI